MITFPKMVAAPLPKRTRVFRVCLPIWEVSKYLFGLPRASVSEAGEEIWRDLRIVQIVRWIASD